MFGIQVFMTLPRVASSYSNSVLATIVEQEVSLGHESCQKYEWFFDFKDGISDERLSRIKDDQVIAWIESKLRLAGLTRPAVSVSGFGASLAVEVLENNASMAEFRRFIRSGYWQAMFGEFVAKLMWILAAPIEQRT